MNRIAACCVLLFFLARSASAQEPKAQALASPDERFKTDILLIVAHPDDEGAATPYLARAIYDEHKRVACWRRRHSIWPAIRWPFRRRLRETPSASSSIWRI